MTAKPTAEGPSRLSDQTEEPMYPERTAAGCDEVWLALEKTAFQPNICVFRVSNTSFSQITFLH